MRSPVAAHVDPAHAIVEIDFFSTAARAPGTTMGRGDPVCADVNPGTVASCPRWRCTPLVPRQNGTAETRQAAELYSGRDTRRRPLVVGIVALLAFCVATVMAASSAVAGPATHAAPASPASYQEPYRPQFHFTPGKNWMNDPNGLVYYKGEYHLFYQYNPSGNTWGNMSWGHAVSTDLVHWKELPVAIPDDDNELIFSGSAVVDTNNTSGFGTRTNPPHGRDLHQRARPGIQAQSLAYSTDGGTTWTKYAGNPVLDIGSGEFRDPKVFWYAPAKQWRDGGRPGDRAQGRHLQLDRPEDLDAPERLRPGRRGRRRLGMPRPVPAGRQRQPAERSSG